MDLKPELIELIGVSKRYPDLEFLSLDNLSFTVLRGEKFGIVGPNGAGKSTFISMLCGLIKPTAGQLNFYFESNERQVKNVLHKIGYVPQEYAFFEELTPMQNLMYFGSLYSIPKKELKAKSIELLEQLGLAPVASKRIKQFSGGMKRRVNLALGLIHNPELLLLDEPTVGVDVQSKMAILELIEKICKQGCTVVYTSHHLKEAEELCDRIALLDHGKIIALDKTAVLISRHEVEDLESFFLKLTGKTLRD